MKYTRGQFTEEYYRLWEIGLLLPLPVNARQFSVQYTRGTNEDRCRVTLKARSVSDALERACYAVSYGSPWRPENIDLHAVFDQDENVLWLDEPLCAVVQKKNEFLGMDRRAFLAKFGSLSAGVIFGLRSVSAKAASTPVSLAGSASGFPAAPPGDQQYVSPGTYTWTVPSGVTSICVVCVGAGGQGGSGDPINGGGGGALAYVNNVSVTPGSTYSVLVGNVTTYGYSAASESSSFGSLCVAGGGGNGNGNSLGGVVVTGTGGQGGKGGTGGTGANGAGGGGAGGYSGKGGDGTVGAVNASAGSGGGGGGGVGQSGGSGAGMGGGGVGLFGSGANGAGGTVGSYSSSCGQGGSGGGAANSSTGHGGAYGGGSGGGHSGTSAGSGAVRIIWGVGRSFPSNAS